MFAKRFYSLLLSLVVAFGLWLYVVNNISQGDDRTFNNVPILVEGESMLNERNLMVTNYSSKTVSIHLSGTRGDLAKVHSGNIIAKLDLSQIMEPGEKKPISYTLSFPGDVPSNAFVVESKTPGHILVDVDYRRSKEVPVLVRYTGARLDNQIYDTENATLDVSAVNISGPAAVADLIEYALVEVDLTGRTESISESFLYTLCNKDREPVDAQSITTNVEEVRLNLQIQQIKELKLTAEVNYTGGAAERNTVVRIEPEVIRVSGSEVLLREIGDEYSLGAINLAELEKNVNELKYSITLPEGITNQTGASEAVVTVSFAGLRTREFTIENISAVNLPEGMEADIINTNITVRVRGPIAQVDALTEDDIMAVVDLSAAELGTATYRAGIVFTDGFDEVGAMRASAVSVAVSQKPD